MKRYQTLKSPKELDFFSIELDENGNKQVHVLGYTYYGDEWHNIEVCWFIEPLTDFIDHVKENEDYVNESLSEFKQYESDNTADEIVELCNQYYDGKKPDYYLDYSEITMETPCGNYVSGTIPENNSISDKTIEKISWYLQSRFNLFHADLIQRAMFDDDISLKDFITGKTQIVVSECGTDNDEFVPEGWENV